ncbi:MAG: hypothetical protein ACJAVI_005852 [Candidatus Azotimanducaceae bacterium]|jgi:hypothetical protein
MSLVKSRTNTIGTLCFLIMLSMTASAQESYASGDIAKRYPGVAMTPDEIKEAEMQGECLVGLKELNFKKKNKFDAIAEWTNYRTISLLEQFSPCDVLVIMEVAKNKLRVTN